MKKEEKVPKSLRVQIFEETIDKVKDQEGFNETIIVNLKMLFEKGEFNNTESIISTIKPKEGK